MQLEAIKLGKISKAQKDKFCMFSMQNLRLKCLFTHACVDECVCVCTSVCLDYETRKGILKGKKRSYG